MSLTYALRRSGRVYGEPQGITKTMMELRARLRKHGGPYRIRRPETSGWGPQKNLAEVSVILGWNLPRGKAGDAWRVQASDEVVFSVKVFEDIPKEVPDGPGTPAIDKIHAATVAFCLAKGWPVTELGICASKPGQHNKCNAWDANAGGSDSNEIHRRLITVGNFLKDEGTKHLASGGDEGLPVLGVIVMEQFWEREESAAGWQPYSGVAHVSHWHVSGFPSMWPGWI